MSRALLLLLALLAAPAAASEFELVSWNVQTFGRVPQKRQALCREAYEEVISSSVWVLAAQEVANERGSRLLMELLPGGSAAWQASFADTPDPMDNGVYFRGEAHAPRRGLLFADPVTGEPDRAKMRHPARWAWLLVEDFDFTLVSVHLSYKKGEPEEPVRELKNLLDWLADHLADPKNDPDVVIAGDFNLPTEAGKPLSARAQDAGWPTLESVIGEHGRLAGKVRVLVDEPTSRGDRGPANNYDHFIVTGDALEELVWAGRGPTAIAEASDHYPVVARFRSRGPGVAPDFRTARGPAPACRSPGS